MLLKLADRANIAAGRLSPVQTPGLTEPPAAGSYSWEGGCSSHAGEQQATGDLKRKSYTSLCLSISVGRGMPDPTKPFLLLQKFCTDLKENLYVNYPRTKSFPPFPQLSSPLFRKQLQGYSQFVVILTPPLTFDRMVQSECPLSW